MEFWKQLCAEHGISPGQCFMFFIVYVNVQYSLLVSEIYHTVYKGYGELLSNLWYWTYLALERGCWTSLSLEDCPGCHRFTTEVNYLRKSMVIPISNIMSIPDCISVVNAQTILWEIWSIAKFCCKYPCPNSPAMQYFPFHICCGEESLKLVNFLVS